jgi:lipoate-protein ligase A
MAVDAALLESAASLEAPVLRFYAWKEPAATFGYSQDAGAVAAMTPLRPLVRRPTGGGLVPHDADWTYSLVVPVCDPWYALNAKESYQRVHEWMRDAFAATRVGTELSPCCAKEAPGRCFAGPERHDLMFAGRKIAGAAQRRTRNGLLIQGSIQPAGISATRAGWEMGVIQAARSWGVAWRDFSPTEDLLTLARRLEAEVYSDPARRRGR